MGSDEGQQDTERMGIDLKCRKTGGGADEVAGEGRSWHQRANAVFNMMDVWFQATFLAN